MKIATLGSSFAAGPAIEPQIDKAAGRSGRNYSHQIAAEWGAELTDLSVSGTTIEDVISQPKKLITGAVYAPQVPQLPTNTDLVFITAGGNDLSFAGHMINHALGYKPRIEVLSEQKIHQVGACLAHLVEVTRERASRARVVLVDYLPVLGEDPQTWQPWFSEEVGEKLLGIQEGIVEVFEVAADQSNADLVQASQLVGHEVNTEDPWVFPLMKMPRLYGSFHPNETGMAAIAQLIKRQFPF